MPCSSRVPSSVSIMQTPTTLTPADALVDRFGRVHTDLRISVTDRCNIRCFYCMPSDNVVFRPRSELLRFEEMERFVRVTTRLGINKVRITGGEPLVRNELWRLIRQLAAIPNIDDIALTTNGILLAEQAQALKDAGLSRLNVSLDTLDEETFRKFARRDGLDRVLDGIAAAQRVGFTNTRLNAIAIRGLSEVEVLPLVRFARRHSLELRFIEFMPLDADGNWRADDVLTGAEIRRQIEAEFGALIAVDRNDPGQPALDYQFAAGGGRIGFINPVTQPFCGDCDRLRLTAEGQIRNCLFSKEEWDARSLLRSDADDEELMTLIRAAVGAKKAGHGIDQDDFVRPSRAMYQIGG